MKLGKHVFMSLVLGILMTGFAFAQDAEIYKVAAPPVIDAVVDNVWEQLEGYLADSHYFDGIENVSGPEDLSMIWKALYDDDNLYFLFDVKDDVLNEDSEQPVDHKDDCVEIFFDIDNGDETEPDPLDDFMLKIEYSSTGMGLLGPDTGTFPTFDTTGVVARCTETETGYLIELLIPMVNMGMSPDNYLIGFDARVNDDDDGDNRDTQMQWGDIPIELWNAPSALPDVVLNPTVITGVEDNSAPQMRNFDLAQNYPNPFNPTTEIRYTLLDNEQVKLTIYDVLGKEIATLVDANQNPGEYAVTFNASHELGSGIYYYQLQTKSNIITKEMVLLK